MQAAARLACSRFTSVPPSPGHFTALSCYLLAAEDRNTPGAHGDMDSGRFPVPITTPTSCH